MNYRRNEDKWLIPEIRYTGLLRDPEMLDTGAEPVTLAEAKTHMRVTYTDDDAYITTLLKIARRNVEKRHNKSLVLKTVTAIVSNGNGKVELPYPPVIAISRMEDVDGNEIVAADYTIEGGNFPWIDNPISAHLQVTYTAGYPYTVGATTYTLPVEYKQEILEEIAYLFTHRGDEKRETKPGVWLL